MAALADLPKLQSLSMQPSVDSVRICFQWLPELAALTRLDLTLPVIVDEAKLDCFAACLQLVDLRLSTGGGQGLYLPKLLAQAPLSDNLTSLSLRCEMMPADSVQSIFAAIMPKLHALAMLQLTNLSNVGATFPELTKAIALRNLTILSETQYITHFARKQLVPTEEQLTALLASSPSLHCTLQMSWLDSIYSLPPPNEDTILLQQIYQRFQRSPLLQSFIPERLVLSWRHADSTPVDD